MTSLEPNLKSLNRELEAFLALLEEEAIALASGNSERLGELTLMRQNGSQNLTEHWRKLAEQFGLPADAGMPALRLRAFVDGYPTAEWRRLEKLTQEAARLNLVNSRLIEEQMRRTHAAMQVLQSASTRSLYGADGRLSDTLTNNRSIDSA